MSYQVEVTSVKELKNGALRVAVRNERGDRLVPLYVPEDRAPAGLEPGRVFLADALPATIGEDAEGNAFPPSAYCFRLSGPFIKS